MERDLDVGERSVGEVNVELLANGCGDNAVFFSDVPVNRSAVIRGREKVLENLWVFLNDQKKTCYHWYKTKLWWSCWGLTEGVHVPWRRHEVCNS